MIEKKEKNIRLYKEGRTVRQIAGLVHMSFRNIGAITNKVKLQAERDRGYNNDDIESKSSESKAFKMLSEGKSPVAILLDLAADRVRDYWDLTGRYMLAQNARYDLRDLLKLHKIVNRLGMN